jgi:hypothetical protein
VTHPQPDQLGSTGNNNYVLRSPGCQPIEGLTVSMQVQEQNLTGLNGFSMQLNAYNPQPITSQCPTNWMQFILANYSGQLRASVQYSVNGQQFNPFQWLALTDAYGKPVSNQNPMQIGQKLTISLAYDNQHKNITGANFLVTEANGETVLGRAYVPAPPSCLYKMLAFQVNIVAAPATHQLEFSGSTGTRGTITYRTSGQQLCNEGASVGSTIFPDPCSGTWVETLETINVGYGAMSSWLRFRAKSAIPLYVHIAGSAHFLPSYGTKGSGAPKGFGHATRGVTSSRSDPSSRRRCMRS